MPSLEKKTVVLDAKGEAFAIVPELPIYANDDMFEEGSVDPVYQAKARVLNAALQEIGMGKYQVRRFRPYDKVDRPDGEALHLVVAVCGRGLRLVRVRILLPQSRAGVSETHMENRDSCWPLLGGLILSPAVNEFRFNGPFLSLAQNIGLFVGAIFWGFGCDIWGRRYVFLSHP